MLRITIPACEYFNEETSEFIEMKEQMLQLEHSLVSLSKWESKWHKPFLDDKEKSLEETIDYIRCMTLTQNVDPLVYSRLTPKNIKEINDYLSNPMTATTFGEDKSKSTNREIITSELVYYWMIALNIPFECQKWHLNRLLTLIRVCNVKNQPEKKLSQNELLRRNAALNAERRKQFGKR